jgi:phosphoribosylformylglycinamidine (FGAM) synthase-like amidotransferase family enzyme
MKKPKTIILSGYGLNCEEETAHAFALAGANAEIIHINALIDGSKKLNNYQILAIPGGFSYGDDTGSGKAYANKLNNHLGEKLREFAQADKLIIGICNGFQILTQTGLLPGALVFNDNARYTVRWVDVRQPIASHSAEGGMAKQSQTKMGSPHFVRDDKKASPWLNGIDRLALPIAHGEGKFFADKKTLNNLKKNQQIALKYFKGEISSSEQLPYNPNGSLEDIAAITNFDGRVLGMMPHPERAISFTHLPHWTLLKEKMMRSGEKVPKFMKAFQVFKNAVSYFQ